MLTGLAAALASGLLVDGSVLSEVRAGSSVGGQDPRAGAASFDLQARASNADGAVRFGIAPSAVLADRPQVFARAFGEAELRLSRTASARLRQTLSYGEIDLSPVATPVAALPVTPVPAAPPTTPVPPGSRFVSVEESNTSLQLDVAPSRRLRFSGFAAWTVAGGADGEAQPFFPLSRGPRVSALLVWSATPLDTLRFETSGSDTRYANGHRASVASFTAGWRTRASRSAELSLSVGPGVGRAQTGEQAAAITPYAVASADLRFAADTGAWVSIGAMLEPLGDPLTGELVERGGARASVTLGRPGGVTVSGRLSGSAALTSGAGGPSSPRAGDLYGQAELGVAIPIDPRSSVTAGGRAAFLSRPLLDQTPRQWVAFVSYAVRLPLSR